LEQNKRLFSSSFAREKDPASIVKDEVFISENTVIICSNSLSSNIHEFVIFIYTKVYD